MSSSASFCFLRCRSLALVPAVNRKVGWRQVAATSKRLFAEPHAADFNEHVTMGAMNQNGDIPLPMPTPLRSLNSKATSSLLFQEIRNSIDRVKLISSKQKVVLTLSVSGGCDSVALLHACMEHRLNNICGIEVLHFNHQQRGKSADQDASFVQEICEDYGIPFHVELWGDRCSSSSQSSFSQDKAREWRRQRLYAFTINRIQQEMDDSVVGIIMTAHHRDDSIESLALKALRGVHLLNLAGIRTMTSLQAGENNIFLLRPWAQNITKQDLTDYLDQRNKTWRDDESNSSPKYLRNRVRNELLPLLQDLTQGRFVTSRITSWMQQSQDLASDVQPRVDHHLELVTDGNCHVDRGKQFFDWSRSCRLINDPQTNLIHSPLIQSQALFQWLNDGDRLVVSYDMLQRILQQLRSFPERREWIIELGQGWNLQRSGDALRMISFDKNLTMSNTSLTADVVGKNSWYISTVTQGSETEDCWRGTDRWPAISNKIIVWVPAAKSRFAFHEVSLSEYEEKMRTHDKGSIMFIPSWKPSRIKIRQFLRMQGVPLHRRDDTCLLVDIDEKIVAVQIHRDENQGEWILHRDYCYGHLSGESAVAPIARTALTLTRQQ